MSSRIQKIFAALSQQQTSPHQNSAIDWKSSVGPENQRGNNNSGQSSFIADPGVNNNCRRYLENNSNTVDAITMIEQAEVIIANNSDNLKNDTMDCNTITYDFTQDSFVVLTNNHTIIDNSEDNPPVYDWDLPENENLELETSTIQEQVLVENLEHQGNVQVNYDHNNLGLQVGLKENELEEPISDEIVQQDLEDEAPKRTRSTKYMVNKKAWNANANRFNREKGKSYLGKKKENGEWKYDLLKEPKAIRAACNCKLSRNEKSKLKCRQLEEEERIQIFKQFWEYSWKEKKVFVKSHVYVGPTARKRGGKETSRRNHSNIFYLGKQRLRVCKEMFLNTLAVKDWVLKKWAKDDLQIMEPALQDKRKSVHTSDARIKFLHEFFDALPKLESHYCRSSSSKLYLEPIWSSKTHLYNVYSNEFCVNHNQHPLSIATFHKEFDKKRLSLYKPKKDLCDTCVAFETGNLTEEKYNEHIQVKTEARNEKSKDKVSINEVFTMDLQSVLLCPKSNVSSLYYKTKLIVHNFTIFDMKRQQGYCYLWNESEGGLTSNEFTSIIISFLESHLQAYPITDNKEIILYSDGCGYQNRNATLSNALFNLALEKKIVIVQKYLQKGHTQMEVDSVHSVIERKIRDKKINVPADYVHICKTACRKTPYKVEYLLHNFFKQCDKIKFFTSIRPGRGSGSPMVNDLKALKYSVNGVSYKLRHPEDWKTLPVRLNRTSVEPVNFTTLPQLHKSRLKIKKEKYQHLQQLKKSMEIDYHNFFDTLPHD